MADGADNCPRWVADLCEEQGFTFVLGHALYMKTIHGGKSKNDRIDSYKEVLPLDDRGPHKG